MPQSKNVGENDRPPVPSQGRPASRAGGTLVAASPAVLVAQVAGFSTAFAVCAGAALLAALLTGVGLSGRAGTAEPAPEALHDPLHPDPPAAVTAPERSPAGDGAGQAP